MSNEITPGKPIRMYQENGQFKDFSTEDVVAQKLNSFLGWKCGAAVENICINFDGDILSASCGVSGPKAKSGKYGNIFEEFEFENEWITCTQQFCSCGADLFIPKISDQKSKALLQLSNNSGPVNKELKSENISHPKALERTFSTTNKQVFWELGRRCNYNCSYCHSYVHNNYEEHKSFEKLIFATERLEKFSGDKKINFAISGGEPTLNPDYLKFATHLHSKGHHVSTHSNGSRSAEYYVELIRISDLNISVHFEFYQKDKLIEVVMAVLNEIHLRNVAKLPVGHFEIMIMSPPGMEDIAFDFEKELWRLPHFSKYCNLNIMPIRDHQSIDNKKDKAGDTLLSSYTEEKLKKYGTKTIEMHSMEIVSSNEGEFSKFDQVDGVADAKSRIALFQSIK